MRRLDYCLGIPLCLLLSLLLKLPRLLRWRKRKAMPPIRRVLFIELSEMGSALLADPAMRKARDKLHAELFFVTLKHNRESLCLLNTVAADHVFSIRSDHLFAFVHDVLLFFSWCRKQQIDSVFDLEGFSRISALLSGLSGACRRVGFDAFYQEGLYRGHLLTHRVVYNPHIHIAKNFLAQVDSLLVSNPQHPYVKHRIDDKELSLPLIRPDRHEKKRQRDLIRRMYPAYRIHTHKLVLLNPNASELLPQRRWPRSYFAALGQRILATSPRILVLITGAAGEHDEGEVLRHDINHERCLNFTGKLALRELPALYSLSEAMVTNDSGPAHFASVTAMPTFVLFGPETPKLYCPLGNTTALYANLACSPCVSAANHRQTPCRDNVCLQRISVNQVFERLQPLLNF